MFLHRHQHLCRGWYDPAAQIHPFLDELEAACLFGKLRCICIQVLTESSCYTARFPSIESCACKSRSTASTATFAGGIHAQLAPITCPGDSDSDGALAALGWRCACSLGVAIWLLNLAGNGRLEAVGNIISRFHGYNVRRWGVRWKCRRRE